MFITQRCLDEAYNIDEEATKSADLIPQYNIIRSGPYSETTNRNAIKQKANAKVKPKPSVVEKLKPAAISNASVADVVAINTPASWFARVVFDATNFVGANKDPRCPSWNAVSYRRAYVLGNGEAHPQRKYLTRI